MVPPGQELVDECDKLRLLLNGENFAEMIRLRDKLNVSGAERTAGLGAALGKDCDHYKKSLTKFLVEDYQDIRNLVRLLNKLINVVEGP